MIQRINVYLIHPVKYFDENDKKIHVSYSIMGILEKIKNQGVHVRVSNAVYVIHENNISALAYLDYNP